MTDDLRNPKWLRSFLLASAMALGLSACGGGSDASAVPAAGNNPPAVQQPEAGGGHTDPGTTPDDPGTPDTSVAHQEFTPNPDTAAGSSDASTAFALPDDFMLVADDEANVLRVYPRAGGAAVLEWRYSDNGPKLAKELDLEAGVRIGETLYLSGSNSNKKDGSQAPDRSHLFAVKLAGTGTATTFDYVGDFAGLEAQLVAWDHGNGHGLGIDHFGFAVSAGAGVLPEQVNGFSIEGMTSAPGDSALWLGFRAPQTSTSTRTRALIVPLRNYAALLAGTSTQAEFGDPIELDLGGRGIRSIDKGTDGHYLITAGPAGPASDAVDRNFALFAWDGNALHAPVEFDNDLESLRAPSGGSFESVVGVPGAVAAGTRVQLLLDNGDTLWPGQTEASKDLPAAQQKFLGFSMTLGAPRIDTAGPVLKSATPSADGAPALARSALTLAFNEGLRLGAGSLVLHTADGSEVERFSAASPQRQLAFNVITLTPSQPLQTGTGYYLTIDGDAITDTQGNAFAGIADATTLHFITATPTPLAVGDVLFMAGNADTTDAFAFTLLKAVNAGTQILFTDRDRGTGSDADFAGIGGESAYVWSASTDLPAGSIVTIQPDSDGNPLASKGVTQGAGGGIGKTETIYAIAGGTVAGLGDGSAGEISAVGTYLASLTLGGPAGSIPASLDSAGTAMTFAPSPGTSTDALYTGSLDRSDLAAFAARVKNPANWSVQTKAAWPLQAGSFYAGE